MSTALIFFFAGGVSGISSVFGGVVALRLMRRSILDDIRAEKAGDLGE